MKTELLMPMPPSVNRMYATDKRTGGRFKTPAYKAWITEAGWMIQSQKHHHHRHTGPVTFTLLVRKPDDNRRRDLDNFLKAAQDVCVRHQILADDSLIVKSGAAWVYEGPAGAKAVIEDLG